MGDQPLRAHRDVPASELPSHWYGDPDSPVDNVTRKLAFEDEHPDIRFVPPCAHDGMWTAVAENGAIEVRAVDLGLLLNKLARMVAEDRLSGP